LGRVDEQPAAERTRPDFDLLAVQGLYTCPTCWSGDEACEACGGSGLVSVQR
jgi:hypothetical protein